MTKNGLDLVDVCSGIDGQRCKGSIRLPWQRILSISAFAVMRRYNKIQFKWNINWFAVMKLFLTNNYRCIRFVTCMIPFILLFWGIRVPDFSCPQKPKPMRRAMLENKKVLSIQKAHVKKHLEPVIINHTVSEAITACRYTSEPQKFHSSRSFLTILPLPPRAPPVQVSHHKISAV